MTDDEIQTIFGPKVKEFVPTTKTIYAIWKHQLHMYGKYWAVEQWTTDAETAQAWASRGRYVTVEQRVVSRSEQ